MKLKVVEKFISINGEGQLSGQLAVFIRLAGCNLNCGYCDTRWANKSDTSYELLTPKELYEYVSSTGIKNVTITGGEPLYHENIEDLLLKLSENEYLNIEIETNGSISINSFVNIKNRPSFTMDYKLPSSNMEEKMKCDNFKYLSQRDTVKFVVGNIGDLYRCKSIIDEYELIKTTNVYISPVYAKADLQEIIEFIKHNKMNGVVFQVQLHKIIWNHDMRGV